MALVAKLSDDGTTLVLEKELNEYATAVLTELVDRLAPSCTIDLQGITKVNSMGIGAWLRFIQRAKDRSRMTLRACSPAFVEQLNMIPNFRDHTHLYSVMRPYRCRCPDRRELELIFNVDFGEAGKLRDHSQCLKCAASLKFEEPDDEYFNFITAA